jgi:hypothetical protein
VLKSHGGMLKDQAAADKDRASMRREDSTTKQNDLETVVKATALHRDQLASVNDAQGAAAWVQAGYADPALNPVFSRGGDITAALARIPQDAAGFEQWKQQNALGATKFIEQNKPTYQTRNLGGKTDTLALPGLGGPVQTVNSAINTQSPDNLASNNTTMRGQSMTDARMREANANSVAASMRADARSREGNDIAKQAARTQIVEGPDGFTLIDKSSGVARPAAFAGGAPVQGKESNMTDAQSKALLFGSRMQAADGILGKLAAKGTDRPSIIKDALSGVPLVGGYLGTAGNVVASGAQQQVEQAQRDFINATLRRESGAVISEPEFDNARKQYFPAVGDTDATRAQKAANRKLATKGVLAEVPMRKRDSLGTPQGVQSGDDLGNGFKVK